MKKNISFIPLDATLARWLCDQLRAAPPASKYAKDLQAALDEFITGEPVTLMLGSFEDNSVFFDTPEDKIQVRDLVVYPKSRKVLMGGADISLTPKEFDILYFLARNRGEVFTKEQIYKAVWEEDFLLADSNIMAFIRKLRKKIEPNLDAPEYILTIWGVGYKFSDQ